MTLVSDHIVRRKLSDGVTLVTLDQISETHDGRRTYTHAVESPTLGDRIILSWGWAPIATPSSATGQR